MNRTQKGAWFSLATALFCIVIFGYGIIQLFILRKQPGLIGFWPGPAFVILMGISIFFLRKKQSPSEVDSDERDNLIQKRAVLVSFISVWVLLLVLSVIPRFIFGFDGSIPVYLLPIFLLFLFTIIMLVYSVAVLVQYGFGGKNYE